MNKEEFFEYHKEFCKKILTTSRKKNEDYTGVTSDPFSNFTAVERNGIATTEQGFLTRMMDKMQRITSYCQRGELSVEDEKVEDTLMDLANYCILFSAYIRSKHDPTTLTTPKLSQGSAGEISRRDFDSDYPLQPRR